MGLLGHHLTYFAAVVVTCVLHCVSLLRICVYLPICAGIVIGICSMIQHVNKLIFS
jgi:hypothetical protein